MIRPARPADAEAMDALHVRAWRHAYDDFIPPDHLDRLVPEERVARWADRIAMNGVDVWVWDQDGVVVGFAAAGEPDEEDAPAGSLWALYVDPRAQGAGVGRALLEHAESALRERGYAEGVLWVFVAGEHSRRFYEHRGWTVEEGSQKTHPTDPTPAVRYRKPL